MVAEYGVWEIIDVPGYLGTLIDGKIPTLRELEELVEWQAAHPMEVEDV